MGVVVSDTTRETAIVVLNVTANYRNKRPSIPLINRMGINTAHREMLMDRTVKPISREPSSAASIGE